RPAPGPLGGSWRCFPPAIGPSHSGWSTATLPIFTILVMALILTAHHRLPSCGAAEEVGEEPGHDGPLEAAHQHAAGEAPAAAQLQEGERGGEIHPHHHVAAAESAPGVPFPEGGS